MLKFKNWILSPQGLWVLFIVWALFISNLWLPRNWTYYGNNDWDLTYSTFEAARKSIIEFGQWPGFNPYVAFGTDTVANPQAVNGGIFFIPVLLFGTFYGYKLALLISIIIGCWGAFKCFFLINQDRFLSVCGALLFVGCSYFGRHIFEAGHSNFMYFYFLPWIIYFLHNLLNIPNFLNFLLPIFLLSQSITGGAPIVFIATSMFILTWALGLWLIEKKGLKPLFIFLFILIGALGISMWKIWPAYQYWQFAPRIAEDTTGINILIWMQSLADFDTATLTWHKWWEFSLGFNLILIGIIIFYIKNIPNYKLWLIIIIPIFWISIGNIPYYFNPWYFLNSYVPFFTSIRAPYRFGILLVFIFCIALMKSLKSESKNQLLLVVLFTAVISQSLNFNAISKKITNSIRINDLHIIESNVISPIKLSPEDKNTQFLRIKNNYSVQNAYEPLVLNSVLDTLDKLVSGAEILSFTPNRITLNKCDSIVDVNLRFNSFWKLIGNGKLISNKGSIRIVNPEDKIQLIYFNYEIIFGLVISLLSLILSTLFFLGLKKIVFFK